MKELGKLALISAGATVGAIATVVMWSMLLEVSLKLVLVPLTIGLAFLKIAVGFVVAAAVALIALPLVAAVVALIVPLALTIVAIASIGTLLTALL